MLRCWPLLLLLLPLPARANGLDYLARAASFFLLVFVPLFVVLIVLSILSAVLARRAATPRPWHRPYAIAASAVSVVCAAGMVVGSVSYCGLTGPRAEAVAWLVGLAALGLPSLLLSLRLLRRRPGR